MLKSLDRHPVLATVLTGVGITALAAGLTGLLAPLTVLDGLWQLGDARLLLALGGFFIASLAAAGIAFAQRAAARHPDDESLEGDDAEGEGEITEGEETPRTKDRKYFT